MTEETKRCQFCGEEILAVARKCKHCGSDLEGKATAENAAPPAPAADYGTFLLAIPVISTLLIWFWVGSMNLLQAPLDTMMLIMIATVAGTALVAAMEVGKAKRQSSSAAGHGPAAWFFILLFIWIIGYPFYLFKRKNLGLPNRLLAGLPIALIFMGSASMMTWLIEDKKAELRGGLENMQKGLESFGLPPPPISKQPQRQEPGATAADRFVSECRQMRKYNAIEFGKMPQQEAEALAVSSCAESLTEFLACKKRAGMTDEDCFAEAAPTGE